MGWETVALAGFSLLSAGNKASQAEAQAKAQADAAVKEGQYQAENIATTTAQKAGKLTTSFLQSGISLDGGPMEVLRQAFASGRTDIDRVVTNANTTSSNAISAGRSKALEALTSAVTGMAGSFAGGLGSVDSTFEAVGSQMPESFAYGLNDMGFGKTAYNMIQKSDGDF